ncbi:MAG: DUF547 domain-containing protein, partial [Bacteroidota bacterium]
MKRNFSFTFILLSIVSFGQKRDTTNIFEEFNDFLLQEVVFGLVDYESLRQNPDKFSNLINRIAQHNLTGVEENHRIAFYINSYNVLVIKQIADNYPIERPLDVEGFFKKNSFIVAGERVTLDEIEFNKLFAATKDPRIHFALGCGARSCPFLYDNAFYPDKLQEQLESRAESIINRPNYVYVDEVEKKVVLNKIFDWYTDQFLSIEHSLIKYVNIYRSN